MTFQKGLITVRVHWKTDITNPTLKTRIPLEIHLMRQEMYSLVQK